MDAKSNGFAGDLESGGGMEPGENVGSPLHPEPLVLEEEMISRPPERVVGNRRESIQPETPPPSPPPVSPFEMH
eukprot:1368505-Amorphochlora_amoeboformis.AAC.1